MEATNYNNEYKNYENKEIIQEEKSKLTISKFEYVLIHIIATFLIYSGVNSTLKMILIWLHGGINIDLGILFILIGRGLLRKSYGWLITLRVITIFFLIITTLGYLNFGKIVLAVNQSNFLLKSYIIILPMLLIGLTYFIHRRSISNYYKEEIKKKNLFSVIFTVVVAYVFLMFFVIYPVFFKKNAQLQQNIRIHKKMIYQQR